MSVRIRFKRTGMPKQPYYRLVAIDRRAARDAAEIEVLGHYNPREKTNALTLNAERITYWLSKGAKPTDTVHSLLLRNKFYDKTPAAAPSGNS